MPGQNTNAVGKRKSHTWINWQLQGYHRRRRVCWHLSSVKHGADYMIADSDDFTGVGLRLHLINSGLMS